MNKILFVALRRSYAQRSDLQKFKGRFQWWKDSVYVTPVPHPLHVGPDFSILDGRKPKITNYPELKRNQEQVELGKKILVLLKQVSTAEMNHHQDMKREEDLLNELTRWTPTSKGNLDFK